MVLGSFLGYYSSVLLDIVFKTKQLRIFRRPYYLFRYFSFNTSWIPIIYFLYFLYLILTTYSNATFLQLLLTPLFPLTFVFEKLTEFVWPLASRFGPSPTFLLALLIFEPENGSKKDFYSNDIIISTYVLIFIQTNVFGSSSIWN